ncbi:MAG: exonuclease SbcCD subunit D [Gomphosphaeria aponina SAG 52.96 = DSM 107014]|uniref:Nuclease SbcCD subunit D n=1 Tax=Gomphosphaeria aponina SAG 52.96 = DSM 107014 TaxID=1521640 RepID=A0A941GU85_9CHRO|nr:exonuclease SbcCD subunit D [Gomphosphaeria aponina SAG 52.96 = DSM 107014]
MIKILHLSDIHMGSGFSHGKVNPATGLNTRLEDFVKSLRHCIDKAIALPVDLVLFGGDAFPDATPPPYIQEAFAAEFRRLADANISTVLLVGNHDQHSQGNGGASLSIYRTLVVPGFIVGDSIKTYKITTKKGDLQVITLPWLTPATLFTRPETEGLSLEEVNGLLIKRLQLILEGEVRGLDRAIPTILLGHLMADYATLGSERFLAVGKGFTIPVSLLSRPEIDYVALGHVHKHQNLNKSNNPPVVYPGSIERVDFSEEKEDKGYVLVEIEKGKVNWEFCTLPVRKFCTIEVDVSGAEEPETAILKAIRKKEIQDAIVRLIYKIRSEQQELVKTATLEKALSLAHNYTIRAELVSQLARPRLPELGIGRTIEPLEALSTYLNNREDLQELQEEMLAAAEKLLAGDCEVYITTQNQLSFL